MSVKNAIKIMLALLTGVLVFHAAIVLQIIPYDIAWGGKLKSTREMYVFEGISILINLLLYWVLLMKGEYVRLLLSKKYLKVILWIFLILFALNTLGNVLAETNFEKFFAIITGLFTLLLARIIKGQQE